jgi:surfactin synthase thioesterase subunit
MRSVVLSAQTYRCRSVDFPVSILTTVGSVDSTGSASLGWRGWLDAGFDTRGIAGEHLTIFDDSHIGTTAGAIGHTLTSAAARVDRP